MKNLDKETIAIITIIIAMAVLAIYAMINSKYDNSGNVTAVKKLTVYCIDGNGYLDSRGSVPLKYGITKWGHKVNCDKIKDGDEYATE